MRLSRIQNQFYALVLSLALVFTPARSAHAVIPLVAMGFTAVTSAGATLTAADIAGLAIATTGIGALLYMAITAPDGSAITVPTKDSAVYPTAVVPAPAAAATTAPVPVYFFRANLLGLIRDGATSAIACAAVVQYFASQGATLVSCSDTVISVDRYAYGGIVSGTVTKLTSGNACPSGYVVSGSTCALSDARLAINDQQQDFKRIGVVYQPYAGDLKGSIQGVQGTTSTSGDSISFVGAGPGGTPSTFTIVANEGGSTTIKQTTQAADSSGASYLKTASVTVMADGTVSGYSVNNVSGSLDIGVAATDGGAQVVSAPSTALPANPTSGSTSSSPPITLPDDYNRETTQGQIRDYLDPSTIPADISAGNVTTLQDAMTARDGFVADIAAMPDAPSPVEPPSFASNFAPFQPAACSPFSYSFGSSLTAGNHAVTLDLCPWVPTIQRIAAWAMYLLTAGLLFQMFTRRPEGGGD